MTSNVLFKIGFFYSRVRVYLKYHCVKSVQIRSYFWSVFSCIRPEYEISLREKCTNTELFLVRIFLYSAWIQRFTPYLDTFHAVYMVFWRIWRLHYYYDYYHHHFELCKCFPTIVIDYEITITGDITPKYTETII